MPPFASYPSLKDRPVFVSGGGSGIGASIVEHFAEQGAKVAFVDIDEAASKALVKKIAGAGHCEPAFAKCDVRDTAAYQKTIGAMAARVGDFTVLVNNAARDDRHSVDEGAKAAVVGMTRGLARDLGPDKIRLNIITPGWIMTQRQIDLWLTPEAEVDLMKAQCLKEKVYPPDIARMVLWLAADDSRLVTAQNFVVDGGRM